MKKLRNIFKRAKKRPPQKQFTHNQGEGKTIVVSDFRWVYSETFKLTKDLQGGKNSFLSALQEKDFYMEDVTWGSQKGRSTITRFHGPYPIEEVSINDYLLIDLNEAAVLLENIMDNPDFNNGFPFDKEFRNEARELLKSSLIDKTEIFWLTKKYDAERIHDRWRYEFWAEFIARNKNELVYFTIGED